MPYTGREVLNALLGMDNATLDLPLVAINYNDDGGELLVAKLQPNVFSEGIERLGIADGEKYLVLECYDQV